MDHPKFQMINVESVLLQKKLSKQQRPLGANGRTDAPPDKYDFRTHGFKTPALRAGHHDRKKENAKGGKERKKGNSKLQR